MVKRYTVSTGGESRTVEVEEAEGGVRVSVGGRERRLVLLGGPAGTLSWLDGTRVVQAAIDGAQPRLAVTVRGVSLAAEVSDARAAVVAAVARPLVAGPVEVRAPIPGRVARVVVKVGEEVAAGKGLAVLEAMKMENEIRAPRAGKVTEIRCAEGAAVESGQVLVVISS
jgi:biotin carboxyl carrier protein